MVLIYQTTVKYLLMLFALLSIGSCRNKVNTDPENSAQFDTLAQRQAIGAMLDSFNIAAANADYQRYFDFFSDDAFFIGTDATERWTKPEFMKWARPYFEKKRTWNFKAINRHVSFGENNDIAWFDELLNTQMKICRGSGVVVLQNGTWKVQEYVLSVTIPNALVDSVVNLKSAIDDSLMTKSLP